MTCANKPVKATVAKSERLQQMLEDPKFREAWDSFNEELAKAAALIRQGVQPLGHSTRTAARRVLEAGDNLPV